MRMFPVQSRQTSLSGGRLKVKPVSDRRVEYENQWRRDGVKKMLSSANVCEPRGSPSMEGGGCGEKGARGRGHPLRQKQFSGPVLGFGTVIRDDGLGTEMFLKLNNARRKQREDRTYRLDKTSLLGGHCVLLLKLGAKRDAEKAL